MVTTRQVLPSDPAFYGMPCEEDPPSRALPTASSVGKLAAEYKAGLAECRSTVKAWNEWWTGLKSTMPQASSGKPSK